jgi:predicted permease
VPDTILNGTFLAWNGAPQTIESVAAWRSGAFTLTGAGEAERLQVGSFSPEMFDVLKVQPLIGRSFAAADAAAPLQPTVVILSYGLWQERFGGSASVLGTAIRLDSSSVTIIGVMPRDFAFPDSRTRAWTAWKIPAVDVGDGKGSKVGIIVGAVARLRPGVSPAQASAEATARAQAAPDAGPVAMALFGAQAPIQVTATDLRAALTNEVRPAIMLLFGAAALLFATAIANVANLQLARSAARHRELTIRAALGAGTGRLTQQLLIENAIVAVFGGAAGLLLAVALQAVLRSVLPPEFPRLDGIGVDRETWLFCLGLIALTTAVCGALPVLHARRLNLVQALSDGGMGAVGPGARARLRLTRAMIVGSQVAVTCLLLIGASILGRSLLALTAADRGYDPRNLLTARLPFPVAVPVARRDQVTDGVLERVQALPGVTAAGISTSLPMVSTTFASFKMRSPIQPEVEHNVVASRRAVTPGYFGALGLRLVAGRALADTDLPASGLVVVINRAFVRQYLADIPPAQAVSQMLPSIGMPASVTTAPVQIIGVVDDVQQDQPGAVAPPEMFISRRQFPGMNFGFEPIFVVRAESDPALLVPALRRFVREEDPSLALDSVMTMEGRVGASLARPRSYAVLLGGFAGFALLIAATGLFGVLSHTVTQRAREIAVRTALGARSGEVIRTVLMQTVMAMLGGVAVGIAAALAVSANLAQFIYGVSARDRVSFVAGPVLLLVAGLISCIVPARRVAQTDPIQILRQ